MAHILVVEDEPTLRILMTRMFRDAGYEVTAAATGAAGLQAALGAQHDLVVLDLMLPDLSGEEVLRVLLAARPDARVLIVSSVSEVGRRVAVLDRGAADFVAKPFVNGDLMARVRLRIRDQGSVDPAATEVGDGAHLDLQRRDLVINGQRVQLSHREFTLMAHLLHRRGDRMHAAGTAGRGLGYRVRPGHQRRRRLRRPAPRQTGERHHRDGAQCWLSTHRELGPGW